MTSHDSARTYRPTVQKRAKETTWNRLNPILMESEFGFEKDTGRFKIGDGVTPWRELRYFTPSLGNIVQEHIDNPLPHPTYDDGTSFLLFYQNKRV